MDTIPSPRPNETLDGYYLRLVDTLEAERSSSPTFLKQRIAIVLSLIGNVDHSIGNGPKAAKVRGEKLNDIRLILSE